MYDILLLEWLPLQYFSNVLFLVHLINFYHFFIPKKKKKQRTNQAKIIQETCTINEITTNNMPLSKDDDLA